MRAPGIAACVVVAALALVIGLHAQTDYLDGWSSDRHEQPAVSVVDQVAVARYLAAAGVDREDYALAFAVSQRMNSEGVTLADLAGPPVAFSTLRIIGPQWAPKTGH